MLQSIHFRDRAEAGRLLAERLQGRLFIDPLVLAVPRGGVLVGAALAHDLRADFDVVLARKLRAPFAPEVAIGAVAENGTVHINDYAAEATNLNGNYLKREMLFQMAELERRAALFRVIRPAAPITGRSVIVVDDGLATGSTLIAALQATRGQNPLELIAAVPVASPDRLPLVHRWCDEIVCLACPNNFHAVAVYYADFHQPDDKEAATVFRDFTDDIPVIAAH